MSSIIIFDNINPSAGNSKFNENLRNSYSICLSGQIKWIPYKLKAAFQNTGHCTLALS